MEELNYLPVHMIVENHEIGFDNKNRKFDLIIVNSEEIEIINKNISTKIKYDEIDKVEISLCSIMSFIRILSVWMIYHIFITIYDKNGNIYSLECENDDVLIFFLQKLHDDNIEIIDILDLEESYLKYRDKVERTGYFERIMPKKAKEHHIEYPTRTNIARTKSKTR